MKWCYFCSLCLLLCSCSSPAVGSSAASSALARAAQPTTFATEQPPTAVAPTPISATEVIRYEATSAARPSAQASCWTSSIAINRADAYRCMQQNQIYDPCFAAADGTSVICQPNPAIDEPGVSFGVAEPLPTLALPSPQPGDAWLVQLEDGSVCSPFTGTRAELAGKLTTYSCATPDGVGAVLLGDLAVGTVWSAEKGIMTVAQGGPQLRQSERLSIARVWQ